MAMTTATATDTRFPGETTNGQTIADPAPLGLGAFALTTFVLSTATPDGFRKAEIRWWSAWPPPMAGLSQFLRECGSLSGTTPLARRLLHRSEHFGWRSPFWLRSMWGRSQP